MHYIVTNGFIDDNRILQEDPFRTVGSTIEFFKENMNTARKIMGVVDEIKVNAEEVGRSVTLSK